MKINSKSGYSVATAQKYIDFSKPLRSVTSEIEVQYEYTEGKRTNTVTGYKIWVCQEGLNPFTIKFEEKPELPPFLSVVELENLQGIEIRSNVYFRASSLKVVK